MLEKIGAMAHVSPSEVTENLLLEKDLGMTATVRRAMALPYNGIIANYAQGVRISMDEAGGLITVKDSIELVTNRANGK
ncbi:MAG: hypothetical protein ACXU86_22330 [Archangium sp.]